MHYSPVLAWPQTVHFHLIEDNIMKRVQVYWNLHRQCYSVRQSGRVIDHCRHIRLCGPIHFNVAPAGRDKVRATGVKNVHATVTGYYGIVNPFVHEDYDSVSYNPFKYDQFVKITARAYDGFDAAPISTADYVELLPNREIRAWGVK